MQELRQITSELQLECLSTAVGRAILSFERNEEKLDVEMARFEFDLNLQTALFGLTPETIATLCDNFLTSE
jgi:hypothetical protein